MPTFYTDAPIEGIAKKVIDKHEELDCCNEAVIKYLFKNSETTKYLGKCSKASGKWQYLVDADYVIEIWNGFWKDATEDEQEALLYHELRHIEKKLVIKDGADVIKWKVRKHDVELFLSDIEHYGAWCPDLQALQDLMQTHD